MPVLQPSSRRLTALSPRADLNRWLLLALQLPAHPSNARVKTWRRLQQLGAIAVKGSLYVLPNNAQAVEDFEWLRVEVEALKGQANVFAASTIGGIDDDEIVAQFRAARDADYKALLADLRKAQRRVAKLRSDERVRVVDALGERLEKIRAIDFFSAPLRDAVDREHAALLRLLKPAADRSPVSAHLLDRRDYQGRTWVTRPRPGVDRLSSAWLISRFIDHRATFDFVNEPADIAGAIAFDMFGAGFGHEGDRCTFEVLCHGFDLHDPALDTLADIVHDLDLKAERLRHPQSAGVAALIDGLRLSFDDDHALLAQGIALLEALYRGLPSPTAPRPRRGTLLRSSGGSK